MKSTSFYFLLVFFLTACCPIIKPEGDNINLHVEIRTTDNLLSDPGSCDGWIRIVNPSHTNPNVKYSWSHDKKYTNYEASDLCPGLYK